MSEFGRRLPLVLLAALSVTGVILLSVPDWPVTLVTVVTVPSGCLLTGSDGVEWISPATLPVPERGLLVTAEHPGWHPSGTLLVAGGPDTVLIGLEPVLLVSVTSEPSGASVEFDGILSGFTPCTIGVSGPGGHSICLSLEDRVLLRDSVCLISGGLHSFHYELPHGMDAGGVLPGMVSVPGGSYRIGEVTVLTDGFLVARFEVTNDRFAEFLNSVDPFAPADTFAPEGRSLLLDEIAPCNWYQPVNGTPGSGYSVEAGYGDHPVTGISLDGMRMYCDWLNSSSGGSWTFRLPTRGEWMIAASAGGSWPWSWGDGSPSGDLLNLSDSAESLMCRCPGITDGFPGTSPAGSFPPNDWGIYDTAGNVWEACSDGTASGGSWLSDSSDCRIDSSIDLESGMGYAFVGFRPVADMPAPATGGENDGG
jgi:formylglycine-generating enzyme required for sulfatase activity